MKSIPRIDKSRSSSFNHKKLCFNEDFVKEALNKVVDASKEKFLEVSVSKGIYSSRKADLRTENKIQHSRRIT